jgi:hypothetical protein
MSFSGNQSCILGGSSRSVFTTDSLLPKSHGAFTVLFHEFFEKCFLVRQTFSSAATIPLFPIYDLSAKTLACLVCLVFSPFSFWRG